MKNFTRYSLHYSAIVGAMVLLANTLPTKAEHWSVFRTCNTSPCTIGVARPNWYEPGWSRLSTYDGPVKAWVRACWLHYNDRSHHSPDIASGKIDCAKLRGGSTGGDSDLVGKWTFGRVNGPVLCTITLTSNRGRGGYVINGCHPNESFWQRRGAQLLFKHRDGKVTSNLTRRRANYWEGPYIPHQSVPGRGIRHYISRAPQTGGGACGGHGYNPYGCN